MQQMIHRSSVEFFIPCDFMHLYCVIQSVSLVHDEVCRCMLHYGKLAAYLWKLNTLWYILRIRDHSWHTHAISPASRLILLYVIFFSRSLRVIRVSFDTIQNLKRRKRNSFVILSQSFSSGYCYACTAMTKCINAWTFIGCNTISHGSDSDSE